MDEERIDRIKACFEFDRKLRCRFLDDEGQSYSDGYYCTLKREAGKNGKTWPKYIAPGEFYKIPAWCPLELSTPEPLTLAWKLLHERIDELEKENERLVKEAQEK